MKTQRIAVIGTGISGNLTARLLASQHDVHIFEANHYVGGHTNTVDVELSGNKFSVDTGFMVFNDRTYPNFCRLLERLGVESQNSDMSFSVRCEDSGVEYQGSSLNGLFAQRRNLLRPAFYRMLKDIFRFNRRSLDVLDSDEPLSLGEYLQRESYSREFITQYLLPMSGAIWSCPPGKMLAFPARFLIGFFQNHGLLQIRDRPQWKTIVGGARNYADRLIAPLLDRVRLSCPVTSVARHEDHVVVQPEEGPAEIFDQVVLASHADQTLSLLADADTLEREILSAFPYQRNEAVLHTDIALLPRSQRAWASWNYHVNADLENSVAVTYDLSRLQNHDSPQPILLTLNGAGLVDPATVLRRFVYHHPAYSQASVAAQQRQLELLGRRRTFFCGAYWGFGFHEDGVNSALSVAEHFGIGLDACTAASIKGESPIAGSTR